MTKELSFEKDAPAPEKTVPEIEAETRARLTAGLNEEKKEQTPAGQPVVNTLKKRSKNRVLGLCIFVLAMLVVVAWVGDKLYSRYNADPQKDAEQVKSPAGLVQARTDLGTAKNPFGTESEAAAPATTASTAKTAQAPQVATFNKSLALAGVGQAAAPQNTPTAAASNPVATASPVPASAPATPALPEGIATVSGVSRIRLNPDLYLPVDTYIPCALATRFVSDVAGNISCIISENVYSASGHVVLIPAGTRARGRYKSGVMKQGRGRMFVIWAELRTPNGIKIPMLDSQVVGQLGEAGIDGWIDTHFWERFGNTMMLSTFQDVMAGAFDAAPNTDNQTDYTANSRAAASEMAKTALDNSINIPPTMYKNQGDVIGIMTGSDIDFSAVYSLSFRK